MTAVEGRPRRVGGAFLGLLIAATLLGGGSLRGQGPVEGRVVDEATGAALLAVSVVVFDGAGDVVARRLTDGGGRFVVGNPPAGSRVEFSALGYRPRTWRFEDGPEALRLVRLSPRPFQLDEVVASGTVECSGRTLADTPELAALWIQVLEAFAGTEGEIGSPLVYRVQEFRRRLDADGLGVAEQRVERVRRTAARPFVGLETAPDGSTRFIREAGDSVVFLAPDERFLSSPAFQERYCLDAVDRRDEGRLGLRFRPRGEGDMTGIFWLGLPGPRLEELELTYRHERWRGREAEATGSLRFRSLADGRTIVDAWRLRVPELEIREGGALADDAVTRVLSIFEFGGRLEEAVTPDGARLFEAGAGVVVGRVEGPEDDADAGGVRVEVVGSALETTTRGDGSFVLPPLPAGLWAVRARRFDDPAVFADATVEVPSSGRVSVDLRLRHPWARRLDACPDPAAGVWLALSVDGTSPAPGTPVVVRVPGTGSVGRTVVDLDGGVVVCGVDRRTEVEVPGFSPVPLDFGVAGRVDVELRRGAPEADATEAARVDVRALDLDTGQPIPGALVSVDAGSATVDDAGRASIGLARSGSAVLRVEAFGYAPFQDTVELSVRTRTAFDVHLAPQALELEPLTVEVTARRRMALRALGDRMRTRPLQVLGPARLERERALGLRTLLQRMGVGFDDVGLLMDARATATAAVQRRPGPSRCRPAVWLDGRRVSGGAGEVARAHSVDDLRLEDLAAVEVHPGGRVPVELLGPGDRCGVVALWTRGPSLGPETLDGVDARHPPRR